MKDHNDLLEFLSGGEAPPAPLAQRVRRDIELSFRARSITLRFFFFQCLGALFSLSVCPQFGIGLVEGHGISHFFRLIGDWACAAFCGSLFLFSGAAVAYLGMKGEELWWVWRRLKLPVLLLPAGLWGLLMLGNFSLRLPGETLVYHLTWLTTAALVQVMALQLRSLIEERQGPRRKAM
jgi:hypothetical protein